MRSPFRPLRLPNPAILDDHRGEIRALERRGLLRGGLSLGAFTMLSGCDVAQPASVQNGLLRMSAFNDWVQARLFDPNKLAPEFPTSLVLRPPRFNAYYDIEKVKPVDGESWRLELSITKQAEALGISRGSDYDLPRPVSSGDLAVTLATDEGRILRHIKLLLGTKRLRDLRSKDAEDLLHAVAAGETATAIKTGKHGRAIVRAGAAPPREPSDFSGGILTFAVKKGLRSDSPVKGVQRFKDGRNTRYLSGLELQRLGQVLDECDAAWDRFTSAHHSWVSGRGRGPEKPRRRRPTPDRSQGQAPDRHRDDQPLPRSRTAGPNGGRRGDAKKADPALVGDAP